MQINSINPQYRAYGTNSVSMKGSIPDRNVVISRVMRFLRDNNLMFWGNVKLSPECGNVTEFVNVFVNKVAHNAMKKEPFYLRTKAGQKEQELLFNGRSMDDIAYQFAKIASGKELYNPKIEEHMLGMYFIGGSTKDYTPYITVPDFFKVNKTIVRWD